MKRTLIIAAALVTIPVAGAFACGSGGHGGMHGGKQAMFQAIDADKDGKVTQAEAQAFGDARFAKTDTDGDGKLSKAELEASMQARIAEHVAKRLARMDTDGDGVLEPGEGRRHGHKGHKGMPGEAGKPATK